MNITLTNGKLVAYRIPMTSIFKSNMTVEAHRNNAWGRVANCPAEWFVVYLPASIWCQHHVEGHCLSADLHKINILNVM